MKVGRNEPCSCGSGKKYKKCCLNNKIINEKLLYIYENEDNLNAKEITDGYLEVMNYILDYANEFNIHTLEELDNKEIIDDFILNVIGDFELVILNLSKEEYDLNILNEYIDKLISTIELDYNSYENSVRCKAENLTKLGDIDVSEKLMLDLIAENHNSIYPYVQLVDDFVYIGNLEKAKYYYNLGMQHTDYEDIDALEQRKEDIE